MDLLVFNLIEFCAGKPILASNMTSPDGRVTFERLSANEMRIGIPSESGPVSLFLFADGPGQFFTKSGNNYLPVALPEELKGFDATGKGCWLT